MARDQAFRLKILQMCTRFRTTENDMKVLQFTKQMLRDFVSRLRFLDGENTRDLFQPFLVMRTKLVTPLRQIRERIAVSRQNGKLLVGQLPYAFDRVEKVPQQSRLAHVSP